VPWPASRAVASLPHGTDQGKDFGVVRSSIARARISLEKKPAGRSQLRWSPACGTDRDVVEGTERALTIGDPWRLKLPISIGFI
jgi:hypothetical protein